MSNNFNCWIRTTIKEIRITANKEIYVKGKKGNSTYPEVRFINIGISFYVPQINDIIIMWFPDSSMDIQYCFATLYNNNLNNTYQNGEGQVGIIESLIKFFKNKLSIKANEVDFNDCNTINFKNNGKNFLNLDATIQVIAPAGGGQCTVTILNAGQNKVKG
jgi:hypothetical protein